MFNRKAEQRRLAKKSMPNTDASSLTTAGMFAQDSVDVSNDPISDTATPSRSSTISARRQAHLDQESAALKLRSENKGHMRKYRKEQRGRAAKAAADKAYKPVSPRLPTTMDQTEQARLLVSHPAAFAPPSAQHTAEYESAGPRFAFEYAPMVLEPSVDASAHTVTANTKNMCGAHVFFGHPAVSPDMTLHLFEPKVNASADPFCADMKNKVGAWNKPFAGTTSSATIGVGPVCMNTHARLAIVKCIKGRQADLVIDGLDHSQRCQCKSCLEICLANGQDVMMQ